MPRYVILSSTVLVLIGSLTLVACDKSKSKTPEPTVTAPEPEPEPEPEPVGPSNTPTQTWAQAWATPSGQPTAQIATVLDDRIYAIAGAYMDIGTPATHVVALSAETGKLLWTYKNKESLSLAGLSAEFVSLTTSSEKAVVIGAAAGKVKKPNKAQAEAITAPPTSDAGDCTAEGTTLTCASWNVTEAGAVSQLRVADEGICYAVAGAREIRCRAAGNGDLVFVVAVPAVPDAKEPEAANFSFELAGGSLIVANYDGTILAFSSGSDDATDEPTEEPTEEEAADE
ncbi:outer membrane protein assembly factor BamB family protein [Enhygromyxa salina]|uniref:Outer membrane protein assembly factor BamB n=1 Tax=Enhygromyxa salina TaxID=215803 RepID=A0A2S9Y4L5_9BACT|nr:PQQ-binding-like beta-propeller repeat protein [Enhygromyxa salina]PRP99940.1 Outer membrane protein assembly factor BamB [Enhygromyxa salina]